MDTVKPPLVLIVDDNPTNLKVLSQTLMREGFDLAIATDGEEALEQIQEELPDLILLDVMMQGLDGFSTCSRLKANPDTQHIPVIFMTALSETVDKVKGLSLGAVDYITKPFEEADVLARVRVHLRLQQAQQQIIAQEKLASLGTLTAGVAHELRNPLNFVTNYAETALLSLEQLTQEPQNLASTAPEHLQKTLNTIQADIEAIQQHGQRAEKIIQSMMQLARSDGQETFQPTDINGLLEQSVQLAYHSFRANETGFTLTLQRDYQEVGCIDAISGDLNRAFINIIHNACYALQQKQQSLASPDFQPTLTLSTQKEDNTVIIRIRDNGFGIAEKTAEQIYNPFFTTKPPGAGTGLGLSLAYDIVVLQHGGSLTLNSVVGDFTEFTLVLPCHPNPHPSSL
ncbi:response regulator [Spirulina sp. CS-785/01]|uniref:hybrid sensor histidine kinase/response regulator n=1 Tax=Spirulina sp. CS-785/01 TaxID=3021716 RepID=UPI00232FF54F|nr:response regulator [Spirulina sp. CS-785/01]MDB9314114.1 response regulator [Spirulina sp. CS-785/01]